ncbi:MAG TPA: hypothetical protein VJZ49_03430 [Syntrophales bacterium]|nr:hypothetical protein [Syntrophales bacterium]
MNSTNGEKAKLSSPKSAKELLDMYFLDMRCALLETAAALDRIERARGGADIFTDPRLENIQKACDIVKNGRSNRAEQFQLLFSEPV